MSTSEIVPSERLAAAVAARRQRGAEVVPYASVADEPWDLGGAALAVSGHVASLDDAAAVVLCAARGADVVVSVSPDFEDALAHDLGRLGEVRRATAGDAVAVRVAALSAETVAVLLALADGCSVNEAAARCFLSERTAFRRVTAAKRQLGVATTAEAVAAVVAAQMS